MARGFRGQSWSAAWAQVGPHTMAKGRGGKAAQDRPWKQLCQQGNGTPPTTPCLPGAVSQCLWVIRCPRCSSHSSVTSPLPVLGLPHTGCGDTSHLGHDSVSVETKSRRLMPHPVQTQGPGSLCLPVQLQPPFPGAHKRVLRGHLATDSLCCTQARGLRCLQPPHWESPLRGAAWPWAPPGWPPLQPTPVSSAYLICHWHWRAPDTWPVSAVRVSPGHRGLCTGRLTQPRSQD